MSGPWVSIQRNGLYRLYTQTKSALSDLENNNIENTHYRLNFILNILHIHLFKKTRPIRKEHPPYVQDT